MENILQEYGKWFEIEMIVWWMRSEVIIGQLLTSNPSACVWTHFAPTLNVLEAVVATKCPPPVGAKGALCPNCVLILILSAQRLRDLFGDFVAQERYALDFRDEFALKFQLDARLDFWPRFAFAQKNWLFVRLELFF